MLALKGLTSILMIKTSKHDCKKANKSTIRKPCLTNLNLSKCQAHNLRKNWTELAGLI